MFSPRWSLASSTQTSCFSWWSTTARMGGRKRSAIRRGRICQAQLYFAEEQERGTSFARNRAITTALAQGAEWIAFIDDDDRPRPDWLAHVLDRQRVTGSSGVTPTLATLGRLYR